MARRANCLAWKSFVRGRSRMSRWLAMIRAVLFISGKLFTCLRVIDITVFPMNRSAFLRFESLAMRSDPVWQRSLSYSTASLWSGQYMSQRKEDVPNMARARFPNLIS